VTNFAEKTFTAQDGLRLYYRDYGDPLSPRTPLLCLTGLTRNSQDYHDLATRLSDGREWSARLSRPRNSAWDPDWRNYQPRSYIATSSSS